MAALAEMDLNTLTPEQAAVLATVTERAYSLTFFGRLRFFS